MRDDDRAPGQAIEEPLEPVEPGEVEVVGGLVEQEHVELCQQDRGRARRAAASPPDSVVMSWSRSRSGRSRSAQTGPIRASRSAPPSASHRVERHVVAAIAVGLGLGDGCRGPMQLGLRGGDPGPSSEEGTNRLA